MKQTLRRSRRVCSLSHVFYHWRCIIHRKWTGTMIDWHEIVPKTIMKPDLPPRHFGNSIPQEYLTDIYKHLQKNLYLFTASDSLSVGQVPPTDALLFVLPHSAPAAYCRPVPAYAFSVPLQSLDWESVEGSVAPIHTTLFR